MKLSVHPPGDKGPDRAFFYGFQRGWLNENPDGMMPADHPPLMRYYPAERGPGVTRFATIRSPRSVLGANLQIHHPQAKIEWFDPPAEGSAVDMHLFLVEDRDEAAAWCRDNFPHGSIHSAIVDESVMGDLLVVKANRNVRTPPLTVATQKPEDLTVIAFGVQQLDGALLLEQLAPVEESSF